MSSNPTRILPVLSDVTSVTCDAETRAKALAAKQLDPRVEVPAHVAQVVFVYVERGGACLEGQHYLRLRATASGFLVDRSLTLCRHRMVDDEVARTYHPHDLQIGDELNLGRLGEADDSRERVFNGESLGKVLGFYDAALLASA